MYLKEKLVRKNILENLRKCWFHICFLVAISLPIITLSVLDYWNLESVLFAGSFTSRFLFLRTFKGRMFYLFFLWLLFIESIIEWDEIVERKPRNVLRIFVFLVCASIPLIYVLSVNFWGVDQSVLSLGRDLGVPERYVPRDRTYALTFHWVLCFEYVVIALPSFVAVLLAYGKDGLGRFSIGLSLLLGTSVIYTIDAFYPAGSFKPFQMLALPTAGCAASILDMLGYDFILTFDTTHVHPEYGLMPIVNGSIGIGWPCAGVHSLFLFTVIILLFFKRSSLTLLHKSVYFVVGALGTYFVNVLRIVSYFVILWNDGVDVVFWHLDADFFHNSVGELYFISWIFVYISLIVSIESLTLVEKVRSALQKLCFLLGVVKSKVLSCIK